MAKYPPIEQPTIVALGMLSRSSTPSTSPAQQLPRVTMWNDIRCCAAGSTRRRNDSVCGAHETHGVDASTRNSIEPVSRTVRTLIGTMAS